MFYREKEKKKMEETQKRKYIRNGRHLTHVTRVED